MKNGIHIDQGKCISCLACVTACPVAVIVRGESGTNVIEDRFCLRCMHCGAVCPAGAITLKGQSMILEEHPKPLPADFPDLLARHVRMRRSFRTFREKNVPREIIEDALKLSDWAASAENQHPVKWLVIESRDTIRDIMDKILEYLEETGSEPMITAHLKHGKNLIMGTPGTLLLAYASEKSSRPETDAAIAMTTAELYLQARGIGTFWTGFLERMCNTVPSVRQILTVIPRDCRVYGAMVCGYPYKEHYLHIPRRLRPAEINWI